METVNSEKGNWEWFGHTVEDMEGLLKNRTTWKVQHTYHDCNRVAHELTKISFSLSGGKDLYGECSTNGTKFSFTR